MSFWRKEHDYKKGNTVYYGDRHGFHTSNPIEVEEHERIHSQEEKTGFQDLTLVGSLNLGHGSNS